MNIEIKRKKLQLMKIEMAKEEMLFKIAEREDEILRIKNNILVQEEAIENIKQEIQNMES